MLTNGEDNRYSIKIGYWNPDSLIRIFIPPAAFKRGNNLDVGNCDIFETFKTFLNDLSSFKRPILAIRQEDS